MPLFSNKFSSKKTPPRKSPSISTFHKNLDPVDNQAQFGLEYDQVKTKLGDQEFVLSDGKWVADGISVSHNTDLDLWKKENEKLQEENNFLRLKVEVLLNMLAETTAEVHLQEAEITNLHEKLKQRSSS